MSIHSVLTTELFNGTRTSNTVTLPAGTTQLNFTGTQSQDDTPSGGSAGDPLARGSINVYAMRPGDAAFGLLNVSPWRGGSRGKNGNYVVLGFSWAFSPTDDMPGGTQVYCVVDSVDPATGSGTNLNSGLTIEDVQGA